MAWEADVMNIYSCLWSQREPWALENQVTTPVMSLEEIPFDFGKI